MRARLYLDEDVLADLAPMLRAAGYDAVTAHESGGIGLGDEDQLVRAGADNRSLLTYNFHDFIRMGIEWYATGRPHAGIVVSYHQYTRRELRVVRQTVVNLLDSVRAEDMRNSIRILDQFRPE